ncbi:MAG: imm11 family protein [Phycisphaerales bacterium]|jgi:hypothetical protein
MRYFAADSPEEVQHVAFFELELTRPCVLHVSGFERTSTNETIEFMDDPDSPVTEPQDLVVVLPVVVAVSHRAKRVLERVIPAGDVEWLRASYRGEPWWIMHGLVRVDALDEPRSMKLREADPLTMRGMAWIRVFPEKCQGHPLFRLARGFESWAFIVSSDFVNAWNNAGLKGFDFVPVDED